MPHHNSGLWELREMEFAELERDITPYDAVEKNVNRNRKYWKYLKILAEKGLFI